MQHIVIRTAKYDNLKTNDWVTNGVGRKVSHRFGYGIMDAKALVDLALRWLTVPEQRNCNGGKGTTPRLVDQLRIHYPREELFKTPKILSRCLVLHLSSHKQVQLIFLYILTSGEKAFFENCSSFVENNFVASACSSNFPNLFSCSFQSNSTPRELGSGNRCIGLRGN